MPRVRATWQAVVLADSDDTVVVEGNHYFPPESIRWEHFTSSDTRTFCPWKGTAWYHHVAVDGAENTDAAWIYPDPSAAAAEIKGRIAFWRGIVVEPVPDPT